MRNEEQYHRAVQKVKRKRSFIIHAIVFLFGSIALFFINLKLVHTYEPWFIGPVAVWFLALFIHGLYAYTGLLTKEWEEREVDKELQKMNPQEYLEDELLPLRELRKNRRSEDDDYV